MKSLSCALILLWLLQTSSAQTPSNWKIMDMDRPRPAVVDPGPPLPENRTTTAPSDAVVLFDGTDLSQWCALDGGPTQWILGNGYMECVEGSGYIRTVRNFGDCQLHLEFATPAAVEGTGQGRGNSGVFLMGLYEVQVLDSYDNVTYADGQAAALYGQYPPLVNACRPPGAWQSYDIIFHRPCFGSNGTAIQPARVTVLHNGVLVQDHAALRGPTAWMQRKPYQPHPDKLPLALQDHGNPVRYRNIWIRELPVPGTREAGRAEITLPEAMYDDYPGTYQNADDPEWLITITCEERQVRGHIIDHVAPLDFFPERKDRLFCKTVDTEIEFVRDSAGRVTGLSLFQGGAEIRARRRP